MNVFHSVDDVLAFLKVTTIAGPSFELALADTLTLWGRPDDLGAGMAIVLDAILAQGYEPAGFTQYDGYRLYRYKPFEL